MKKTISAMLCAGMILTGAAAAQGTMKGDHMAKDAIGKPMTMQECKDHMAMSKSDAMKKDAKKDGMCADMMKKDGGAMMKKDGGAMMKKDGGAMMKKDGGTMMMKSDDMAPKK